MKSLQVVVFSGLFLVASTLSSIEPCYYYGDKLYCLEIKNNMVAIDRTDLSELKKNKAFYGISAKYIAEGLSIVEIGKVSKERFVKITREKSIKFWPVVSVKNGQLLPLTGEMGVVFKKDVPESEVYKIIEKFELSVARTIKNYKNYYVFSVKSDDPFLISRKIYETGFVKWAQPIWLEKPVLASVPNDTLYSDQWQHQVINSEEAWDFAKGNADVKIAVVDSGVDTVHFDLLLQLGISFVPTEPQVDPNMGSFQNQYIMAHGTAVSGIAAGRGDNGFGITGVCPQCSVIPIKYIGLESANPPTDRKFNAIKWAVDAGAWVINNSWTIAPDKDAQDNCIEIPLDNFVKQMIDYATEFGRDGLGTVIVWAAGNSTCDTALNPSLNDDRIVMVSGLDIDSTMVYYSNYGDNIDIAAPAGDSMPGKGGLVTTDSTLNGKGFNPAYNNANSEYNDYADQAFTKYFDGTSAAAPVVAGAIALMMSTRKGMTYTDAIDCMKSAASVPEAICGHGDLPKCFGAGILNVGEMVKMASNGECGGEELPDDEKPDDLVTDSAEVPDEAFDDFIPENDTVNDEMIEIQDETTDIVQHGDIDEKNDELIIEDDSAGCVATFL